MNHGQWTQKLKLPPLINSIDLEHLPAVQQVHLAGKKDKIVPIELTETLVPKKDLIVVPQATHESGYEDYYSLIYR